MKHSKKLYIGGICLLLIVVATAFYFIGYKVAYDRIENATAQLSNEMQTFYATIVDVGETYFLVKGIDANDINFRGEFTFPIMGETSYTWRGTEIAPSDLDVGDTISITFSGYILETSPAQISDVIKIQLLDDDV